MEQRHHHPAHAAGLSRGSRARTGQTAVARSPTRPALRAAGEHRRQVRKRDAAAGARSRARSPPDPVIDARTGSLPLDRDLVLDALQGTLPSSGSSVRREAFIRTSREQQNATTSTPANRVLLKIVNGPSKPAIVIPRKKTLPIVVFLAMLVVTAGLVLALENTQEGPGGAGDRGMCEARTR